MRGIELTNGNRNREAGTRWRLAALTLVLVPLIARAAHAADPLERANYRDRISGPALEPGALEGKVVLLEYFGFR